MTESKYALFARDRKISNSKSHVHIHTGRPFGLDSGRLEPVSALAARPRSSERASWRPFALAPLRSLRNSCRRKRTAALAELAAAVAVAAAVVVVTNRLAHGTQNRARVSIRTSLAPTKQN